MISGLGCIRPGPSAQPARSLVRPLGSAPIILRGSQLRLAKASVAQWIEQGPSNPEVAGSNPVGGANV